MLFFTYLINQVQSYIFDVVKEKKHVCTIHKKTQTTEAAMMVISSPHEKADILEKTAGLLRKAQISCGWVKKHM